MRINKTISLMVLFLSMSAAAFAFGACDKTRKAASNAATGEVQPPHKAETPTPDASVAAWPDDPLLFIGRLTGNENIIEIHGDFEAAKLKKLLDMVHSGKTDGSSRHYFSYSAELRPAPVTTIQRRLDAEIALSRANRELNQETYAVDIEYTIRSHDGKIVHSLQNRAALELTPDIALISRRPEKIITYVVDLGEDNFGYGIYYIFSAIAVENRDSDFYRIMAGIQNNDHRFVNAILQEKIALQAADQGAE